MLLSVLNGIRNYKITKEDDILKIIFMGTPEFAVPILEKIASVHDVVLVVTQPDSFNQRKKELIPSPVKKWAVTHGYPVFQPVKIRDEKEPILSREADFIVTAAYGQIVPKAILSHPKYYPVNVHGSLLPKYRGGAPIQRAIIEGETITGITIMIMSPKMDAGDILAQKAIPIEDTDTQDTLFSKLSLLGSEMILEVLQGLQEGRITPVPQKPEEVTFAYNLTKEDEKIDFTRDARAVFNQIRGLNANPGAYFSLDGIDIKVYNSRVNNGRTDRKPGTVISVQKDSIDISCGNHTIISLTEIQYPSKKRMSVRDFLNGSGRGIFAINKEIV